MYSYYFEAKVIQRLNEFFSFSEEIENFRAFLRRNSSYKAEKTKISLNHEITTLEVTPRILGLSANVFFYISPNFYFFRINPIVYVRYGISNYKETIN